MSQTTTDRPRKSAKAPTTTSEGNTMSETANVAVTPIEINGKSIPFPARYANAVMTTGTLGVPTERLLQLARFIDRACASQFRNNENALVEKNGAKPDEYYMDKWLGTGDFTAAGPYLPSVRGTERAGSEETMQLDATEEAWLERVKTHNDSVKAGTGAVIKGGVDKNTGQPVVINAFTHPVTIAGKPEPVLFPSRPTKVSFAKAGGTAEMLENAQDEWDAEKDAFLQKLRALPSMADAIKAKYDAIKARKDAKKGNGATPVVAATSVDLLEE